MTTPQRRRLLTAAPLLAVSLIAGGLGRKEVIALAREKFPSVMNRSEPARFLVMVFDSTDRYLWGFPVNGGVMIHVGGDTMTGTDRRAVQAGGRRVQSSGAGKRYSSLLGVPAYVRDSTRAMHVMPMNTDDGLIPTAINSDESGIEGVLARDVVYVDRFALFPGEDPPLQFDIFAVHLDVVRADTGRPVRTRIPLPWVSVHRDTTPVSGKKKARVKQLVMLPMPVPDVAKPYEFEACFDVAPTGEGKLLSWIRSLDLTYNSRVRKTLDLYRFVPGTLDGVAVRDTVCVRAKAGVKPPGH
jgi:hypothetical protein